jgi:hypothetical protein
MAEIPDETVVRDRIQDGDAARRYARLHELTADWIYEMTKRLVVELERQMKAVEDADRSGPTNREKNAGVLASLERTLNRISNTKHGKTVLIEGSYEVLNADDQRTLESSFDRIAATRGAR